MANDIQTPPLLVYSPVVNATPQFIEDLQTVATGYQHTIRRLGGYWSATWKIAKAAVGANTYTEWQTNRAFSHFVEGDIESPTFEGSIESIQVDNDREIIDVVAYGYVHSIQHRYNSATNTSATANASDWLETMRAADCEFILAGKVSVNTLQCYQAGGEKCWDEMIKVVELGDGTNPNPWRIGVYQGRRLDYGQESSTPIGYVAGGIRWRMDTINDLKNYVVVQSTDEEGNNQADIIATLAESISRYGRREVRLVRNNLPVASGTALSLAYCYEHAWPRMRAVGNTRAVQVYDVIGTDVARLPWLVQPGVYCDMSQPGGAPEYLSWMTDRSHFLVDEVTASASGVKLRTAEWTESDSIDAYYYYQSMVPNTDGELGST